MNKTIVGISVILLINTQLSIAQTTQITDDTPNDATKSFCPSLNSSFKRGATDKSTKNQVTELQKFFEDYYDVKLVSGVFGRLTHNYVIRFQNENGLPAYGVVGSLTREKIKIACLGGIVPQKPIVDSLKVEATNTGVSKVLGPYNVNSGSKSWSLAESGMYQEGTDLTKVTGKVTKEISLIYNRDNKNRISVNTYYTNGTNVDSQINTCYEVVRFPAINKTYYFSYYNGFFYDFRPEGTCVLREFSHRKIYRDEKLGVTGAFNISENMVKTAKSMGVKTVEIGEAGYDKIILNIDETR